MEVNNIPVVGLHELINENFKEVFFSLYPQFLQIVRIPFSSCKFLLSEFLQHVEVNYPVCGCQAASRSSSLCQTLI